MRQKRHLAVTLGALAGTGMFDDYSNIGPREITPKGAPKPLPKRGGVTKPEG